MLTFGDSFEKPRKYAIFSTLDQNPPTPPPPEDSNYNDLNPLDEA